MRGRGFENKNEVMKLRVVIGLLVLFSNRWWLCEGV